jgi:hypothetical protein
LSYRHKQLAALPGCTGFQRSAAQVEALVVAQVRQVAASPQLREAALARAREELQARQAPLQQERERILSQLAAGERAFDRWAERLTRGAIDEEQFERLNWAHLAEKRRLRERLAVLEAEQERAGDAEVTIAEVERALQRFEEMWEALSRDEQRELLRSLVERLTLTPDRLRLKLLFLPEGELPLPPRGGAAAQPAPAPAEPVAAYPALSS